MPDLIIYSNTLDFNLKNLPKANSSQVISFCIFQEDLRKKIGEKIEKIVNGLIKKGLNFFIYPLPLCLFNGIYSKNIQNHIFNKKNSSIPVFLNEHGIKYVYTKEDQEAFTKNKLDLFSKCSYCRLRIQGKCKGIYNFKGPHHCNGKLKDWLDSQVNLLKKGKLLDCGCGVKPSFLEFYKEISLKGKKIYLLDPLSNSLTSLRQMIPNYYTNIALVESTTEEMAFKDNIFDIVVLTSTYSHLRDLNKALLNIKRVLKNDGLLLIRDGVEFEWKKSSKEAVPYLYNLHFRNHNLNQAISELKKHHFKVIDTIEEKGYRKCYWAIKARNYFFSRGDIL